MINQQLYRIYDNTKNDKKQNIWKSEKVERARRESPRAESREEKKRAQESKAKNSIVAAAIAVVVTHARIKRDRAREIYDEDKCARLDARII